MGRRVPDTLTTPLRKKPYSRLAIGEEWYSIIGRKNGFTTHQLRCAIGAGLLRYRRATASGGGREKGTIVVEEEVVANLDLIRKYARKGRTPLPPELPKPEIWSRRSVILPDALGFPKPRVVAEVRQLSPEQLRSLRWARASRAWWSSPDHTEAKHELRAERRRGMGVAARNRLRRRLMRLWLEGHPERDPRTA
jgi:hypothetical protein